MRNPTVAQIVAAVSRHTQTQVDKWGYAKRGPVAVARDAAILIARRLTDSSYPEIQRAVGHLSHSSTRMSHLRAIERERNEPDFAAMVADVVRDLESSRPTGETTLPSAVRDMHAQSLEGRTFSQAEIAAAYGVSRNAICIVDRRAKDRLRAGLLDDPYVREWLDERGLAVEEMEACQ